MGKGLALPKQYLGLKSMHLGNFPQVCTALDPRRLKRIANYAKKIAAPCFVEVALKKYFGFANAIAHVTNQHHFPSWPLPTSESNPFSERIL